MVWLLPGDMQASPIHHTHDTFSRDTCSLSLFLASIPSIGVHGIWWSIPIGWALADIYGQVYYWKRNNHYLLLPSFHNKKHKLCPYFTQKGAAQQLSSYKYPYTFLSFSNRKHSFSPPHVQTRICMPLHFPPFPLLLPQKQNDNNPT